MIIYPETRAEDDGTDFDEDGSIDRRDEESYASSMVPLNDYDVE